jgi:hypothetical protein
MSRGSADVHTFVDNPTAGPRQVIGIGVPSFGMVSLYWAARLLALRMPFNTVTRYFYVTGQEVGIARNQIVHLARQMRGTGPGELRISHLLFLDDDVLFHPDLLVRLLSHNRPMVSGLYYTKTAHAQPLMFKGENQGTPTDWKHGDLVDVSAHGMGLCLINLDVFDAIDPPQFPYGESCPTALPVDAQGYPAFFTTTRDGRDARGITNETEDVYFCRLAREVGVQPVVDTSAAAFGFHFDGSTQRGYPLEQWEQFKRDGSITWPGSVIGDPVRHDARVIEPVIWEAS